MPGKNEIAAMPDTDQPSSSLAARALRDDIAALPMLPGMITSLAMLDLEDPQYFDKVLQLVRADPGFAVRLLRLANSAASGSHNSVGTVEMALIRVGARATVELMLAEKAVLIFPAHEPWQRDLWGHSLLVASYMRRLAPMLIDERLDANEAYLAGLLHDIGRFLMFARMPEAFETIEDAGWNTPSGLLDAEMAACSCTHTQLAYEAMMQWRLPPQLALAARDHHRTHSDSGHGKVDVLVALLRDVDWLAMIVAREGSAWLEQPPQACEDACDANMRLRYRGDIAHRLAILRGATLETSRLLTALGMHEALPAVASEGNGR